MDTIKFTFEETGEEVIFAVLGSVDRDGTTYVMVVEQEELEEEDMTAYILKAVEEDGEDVIYEIVDDEEELDEVTELFDEVLENFEIEEDDDFEDDEDDEK